MTERKITKSDCKYYRESDGNCLNFTYVGEYDPCTDGDLEHCYEKFPHFFNKDKRMTEKRFKLRLSKLGDGMITDTQKREELYFDKEFLDATLPKTNELLNELAEENEQLRKENDMLSCELSVSANKEISRNCRIVELEEENEQLKQHNVELINKIDFLERVIDGDV